MNTTSTRDNVLVIDDSPENLRLAARILARNGLVPRPVLSGRQAIEAAIAERPDLVLLDITMPEMSGFEVCRYFKQHERLKDIPIIFLSGRQGVDDKVEAFRAGGVDYIPRPFDEQDMVARVGTHLRLRKHEAELASWNQALEQKIADKVRALTSAQVATIFALAKLAEARDDDTGRHIERVQVFSRVLADGVLAQGRHVDVLTASYVETLEQTASLHDIGKVAIPDAILLKRGKLTADEFTEMKRHSLLGASTLAAVLERHPDNQFLRMGVEVARSHHEKWDGSGYPDGLSGVSIPMSARIVAVADVYDALTSNRYYRAALPHGEACRMIGADRGKHFDPDVVDAFRAEDERLRQVRDALGD